MLLSKTMYNSKLYYNGNSSNLPTSSRLTTVTDQASLPVTVTVIDDKLTY